MYFYNKEFYFNFFHHVPFLSLLLYNLTLFKERVVVCSQVHTKHKNLFCGPIIEGLSVKLGGIYSSHYALTV